MGSRHDKLPSSYEEGVPRQASSAGVVAGVEGAPATHQKTQLFAPPLPRPVVAPVPSLSKEGTLIAP
jgi:hypothetical protein